MGSSTQWLVTVIIKIITIRIKIQQPYSLYPVPGFASWSLLRLPLVSAKSTHIVILNNTPVFVIGTPGQVRWSFWQTSARKSTRRGLTWNCSVKKIARHLKWAKISPMALLYNSLRNHPKEGDENRKNPTLYGHPCGYSEIWAFSGIMKSAKPGVINNSGLLITLQWSE